MANDSKASIDGNQITGDWAREETMSDILAILEKKYGKGGKKKTNNDKDDNKQRQLQSKLLKGTNDGFKKYLDVNKKRIKQGQDFIKSNKFAAEGLDILGDAGHLAGKTVNKFGGATSRAVKELDNLDGSVQGASDAFFKVVGGAGAIGTAFGVVAGIIDSFAEFQTAAIQTGFSFSQELVNTRGNVAGLGMNMKQLSDILVSNGEAVRALGGSGAQSANAFIDLVGEIKSSARQFGLFGMTSEEIAGVTAERLDLLRRQGFVEEQARQAAVESFTMLNSEVLAYSKLTGRDRREIMRNNLAMREGSELLLSDLATLGPNATTSFDSITQGMSAVFGSSGDEFASIFGSMVESHFMGGMERLSSDQMAALSQIPGLREIFEEARNQFIQNADNPAAMKEIQLNLAEDSSAAIQAAMDNGLVSLARMQEDSPVGALLTALVGARQQATVFLDKTTEEIDQAFNGGMDKGEAELLMIRERIQVLQNEFQAMLLSALTFGGSAEDLASEANFEAARASIQNIGRGISSFLDMLKSLGELMLPDGTGSIATAFVGGIGLMFAAQGAVTLAMVAGARLAFSAAAAMFNPVTLAAIVTGYFATSGAMDSVNNSVNGWLNDKLGTNLKTDYDMKGWWERYKAGETSFWLDTPLDPTTGEPIESAATPSTGSGGSGRDTTSLMRGEDMAMAQRMPSWQGPNNGVSAPNSEEAARIRAMQERNGWDMGTTDAITETNRLIKRLIDAVQENG